MDLTNRGYEATPSAYSLQLETSPYRNNCYFEYRTVVTRNFKEIVVKCITLTIYNPYKCTISI